jgi:hypothetical protein
MISTTWLIHDKGREGATLKRVNLNALFLTPEAACRQAAVYLRMAGFVEAWQSEMSEARYFVFPKRTGTLRLATHAKGGRNPRMPDGPTLASVTFARGSAGKDGLLKLTATKIENVVAYSIGLYMIRSELR